MPTLYGDRSCISELCPRPPSTGRNLGVRHSEPNQWISYRKIKLHRNSKQNLSGMDDLLTGVLSKSKGYILRLAAVFNALSIDLSHIL